MAKHRRSFRNILINPAFQLKLLSYFVGLFLLTSVSLYSTILYFFWHLEEKALAVGIPKGHVFFQFVANQKTDLDLLFLGFCAFNFVLLVSVGFIISHRVAGPLHKLKNYLKDVSAGSGEFRLREKDFFRELEPTVNEIKARLPR